MFIIVHLTLTALATNLMQTHLTPGACSYLYHIITAYAHFSYADDNYTFLHSRPASLYYNATSHVLTVASAADAIFTISKQKMHRFQNYKNT